MIGKLDEINRALIAAADLGAMKELVPLELVLEQCRTTVIEGRMPSHEDTVSFCERLGLLTCSGAELRLTESGRALLNFNPDRSYDLSDEQQKVILRTCYLDGPFRPETYALLRGFSPAYDKLTFRWSAVDNPPLVTDAWVWEHLLQLGLLTGAPDALAVNLEYSKRGEVRSPDQRVESQRRIRCRII